MVINTHKNTNCLIALHEASVGKEDESGGEEPIECGGGVLEDSGGLAADAIRQGGVHVLHQEDDPVDITGLQAMLQRKHVVLAIWPAIDDGMIALGEQAVQPKAKLSDQFDHSVTSRLDSPVTTSFAFTMLVLMPSVLGT